MSSWTRTAARAHERRAEKKLLTADRKRRLARGEKAVSRKTKTPATTGSLVSRVAALKAKAEKSKARKPVQTQIVAAPIMTELEMRERIEALVKQQQRERIANALQTGYREARKREAIQVKGRENV